MDGFTDPILINRFNKLVSNINTSRMQDSANRSANVWDRRRDLYDECGFPIDTQITPQELKDLYNRDAFAARVVELWPKECWQVQPEIYETEDEEIDTPFEIDVKSLGESLVSEPGYFKDDTNEGNPLWEYLLRADIMSGIGRYGVILLGLNDGKPLDTPVDIKSIQQSSNKLTPSNITNNDLMSTVPINTLPNDTLLSGIQPSTSKLKLQFMRIFDESLAQISSRNTDMTNPRWGQPEFYNITFDNPDDMATIGSVGSGTTGRVHWTRCVHIVDNIQSNEILGQYRCKPVLNDILTAQKSRWGSGEMFWNGASPKISFETHPQLGGDVQINKGRMRNEVEKALRGLQQWWSLIGMTAKTISPVAVDPKPFIDSCIQSICIKIEVPIPVFIGHEIGQLAGEMNVTSHNKKIKERHYRQCTPRIICPLFNRLINLGVISQPTQGYKIFWPDVSLNTDKDKAQLQSLRIGIVVNYIKNGLDKLIPPVDFLVKFLDMKEAEAVMLVEKAKKELMKQQAMTAITTQSLTQTPPSNPTVPPINQPSVSNPQTPVSLPEQTTNVIGNSDCGTGYGGFKSGNTCQTHSSGAKYHTHEHKEVADKEAIATHGQWGKSLSEEQKSTFNYYSSKGDAAINDTLRFNSVLPSKGEIRSHIVNMDKAISSAPPFEDNSTKLYRGLKSDIVKSFKPGFEFTDKGFPSTTSNLIVAEEFKSKKTKTIIEIINTKGLKAASMTATGTGRFVGINSENEYILARGTKFKVVSEAKKHGNFNIVQVEVIY